MTVSKFANILGPQGDTLMPPPGGTAGQVLNKLSATDYDVTWASALTVQPTSITVAGNALFTPDNTHDIGAAGANRPRDVYFGRQILAPNGTAAAPSYSFVNSTGTGMSMPTLSTLTLGTAGVVRLTIGSTGTLGIATAPTTFNGVTISIPAANLATTSQAGVRIMPQFSSAATNYGSVLPVTFTSEAGTYTMTNGYGVEISSPVVGMGAIVTTMHGLYIRNQGPITGTVTNAYGIWIDNQSGASTTNVGLRNEGSSYLTQPVVLSGDPTNAMEAVTKQYVDARSLTWPLFAPVADYGTPPVSRDPQYSWLDHPDIGFLLLDLPGGGTRALHDSLTPPREATRAVGEDKWLFLALGDGAHSEFTVNSTVNIEPWGSNPFALNVWGVTQLQGVFAAVNDGEESDRVLALDWRAYSAGGSRTRADTIRILSPATLFGATVGTATGLRIENQALVPGITNAYGIWIENTAGASGQNVGLRNDGVTDLAERAAAVPNPPAGVLRMFPKADRHLWVRDSTGVETDLMGAAAGADNVLRAYIQSIFEDIDPGGPPAPTGP